MEEERPEQPPSQTQWEEEDHVHPTGRGQIAIKTFCITFGAYKTLRQITNHRSCISTETFGGTNEHEKCLERRLHDVWMNLTEPSDLFDC